MKHLNLLIRPAKSNDLIAMQKMFVDTISTICKDDYTPNQIKAWTSSIEDTERWTDKLHSQYFLIAEVDNKIVGYASLDANDCLDFLYVHKDFQRQGIAKQLYAEIEKEAIKRKAFLLTSEVSRTATPFFEKMGFKIVFEQTNLIKNEVLVNYKMSKQL